MRRSTSLLCTFVTLQLVLLGDRKASTTSTEREALSQFQKTALQATAQVLAQAVAAKPQRSAAETEPTSGPSSTDVILRAMKDELARSRQLSITSLDVPYFIEYDVDDAQQFNVTASLGGLVSTSQGRFRVPRVRVRVGDYAFDNTNYVYADFFGGTRYDSERLSLDDSYAPIRYDFWLATDRAYKGAVESIARKRAALKSITQSDELPDFWKSSPVQKVLPPKKANLDTVRWTAKVREWSNIFAHYPQVFGSQVSFDASQSTHYMHNSEGSTLRLPDSLFYLTVRAAAQAPDGMTIRDSILIQSDDLSELPADGEVTKAVTKVAENLKALSAAPVAESYNGPVLFEGVAAAQIFGEVFGSQLTVPRRPVGEPGRNVPFSPSDLEGRIGSRVLPDFLDVTDDPTQEKYKGIPMFGTFTVDEDGVVAKLVKVVEKGKLQNLLLTRQPVKGFKESNGRARLPGSFGFRVATFGNLFVQASETVKEAELKTKLIEIVKQRNKPYGMIIRKMDFPSTASLDELRSIAARVGQGGRPVSAPILAYRVYPDGREELVRGLRLRAFGVRAFRDILAASSETYVFHVMNNMLPFALVGGASYVAPQSIVSPSLLFEDVDLERPQENLPKLPAVPPPALTAAR